MRSFLFITLILSVTAAPAFADDVVLPDGTDWRRATEQERLAYITGFSNALSLGYISDENHIPGNKETFTHRVVSGLYETSIEQGGCHQSTQVKDTEPDQQGLLVMNLCGLGLRCREFDRPGRWL